MPNFTLQDDVFFRAAEQFPTPFHLYDEAGIRRRARELNKAFAWCGDFREYFAVKALPNPAILRILKEEGCGLDCSSATELTLAKACGFSGEEIILSALEYRLLLLFANNQGIVLTRAKLLQDLWDVGGEYVNDNTLTVYIKRLREKIEDDPAQPMLIRTIRGFGYKAGE